MVPAALSADYSLTPNKQSTTSKPDNKPTRRCEMYQTTAALQLNSDYMQHELVAEAEARRLAKGSQEDEPQFSLHRVQRRFVAVAVALVTVLGVVALF
jgi:hypothetical protein